jgi:hypothetical protein
MFSGLNLAVFISVLRDTATRSVHLAAPPARSAERVRSCSRQAST